MSRSKDMNIQDKRLATFNRKRRASAAGAANAPSGKWPLERPSPQMLAEAGFYFNPSEAHPDNVTCYLCDKDLDGWEYDDNPVVEHYNHCPDCGWAQVAYALAVKDDAKQRWLLHEPRGEIMKQARVTTFGKRWWPHEDKRGWFPKIEAMAVAGWYYAPGPGSRDNACCAYCELSLHGWEAGDDPLEEHRRRSSDCLFFTWKTQSKKPTKRPSRLSTQSAVSSIDGFGDEPVKKTARSRKPKRAPAAIKGAPVDPPQLMEEQPTQPSRGRKRSSSVARVTGPVIIYDGGKDTDEEPMAPPAKRRVTRASLAKQSTTGRGGGSKIMDSDDESVVANPTKAPPKKIRRSSSRARGSQKPMPKTTRTLIPDDEEIDRALAFDLERPLTDEEDLISYKKPFIRSTKRLTRSRTSIAVEERIRDAPEGVLVPSVRRGDTKSWAPTDGSGSFQRSPAKGLFKESGQDFSMPIVIPRHLAQASDNEDTYRGPGKKRQDVDDKIHRDASRAEEPQVKKPAPKKVGKGRKATTQEADTSKPRRKPPAKKGHATRSRSNSADSHLQLPVMSQGGLTRNLAEPPKLMRAVELEKRGSVRPEDPDQTEDEMKPAKAARPIVRGRIVSFTEKAPPPGLYTESDTEIDEIQTPPSTRPRSRPAALPLSPARMPQSPARIPLSPVRTQITVPTASTPKGKLSGGLITNRPWIAVDLDTVFHKVGEHEEEEVVLGEGEKDMTVTEWVKWNAAKGEERLVREAERVIEIFRREGRRAIEAVEGIETS